MNKILTYHVFNVMPLTALATLCPGFLYQAQGAAGGGKSSLVKRIASVSDIKRDLTRCFGDGG